MGGDKSLGWFGFALDGVLFHSVLLTMFWGLPSILTLFRNSPDGFQRMGSVAVLWAVIFFTFNRRYFSALEGEIINPDLSRELDKIYLEQEGVLKEIASFGSWYGDLNKSASKNPVGSDQLNIKARLEGIESNKERIVKMQDIIRQHRKLRPGARFAFSALTIFETAIFSIGTVQSGFGDFFVCWFNSGSLNVCSP